MKENRTERIFEEIIGENFPQLNWTGNFNPHFQKALQTPKEKSIKKTQIGIVSKVEERRQRKKSYK